MRHREALSAPAPRAFTAAIAAVAVALAAGCVSARERHAEAIHAARVAVQARPGAQEARALADALLANFAQPARERAPVTEREIEEAAAHLDAAAEASPREAAALLAKKGALWGAAGRAGDAEEAYRASLRASPTNEALWGLIGVAGQAGRAEQVRALCVEGAASVPTHELRAHLDVCARAGGLAQAADAAAWLKDEDQARWRQVLAALQVREEAERRERAARKEKLTQCLSACTTRQGAAKSACSARCHEAHR